MDQFNMPGFVVLVLFYGSYLCKQLLLKRRAFIQTGLAAAINLHVHSKLKRLLSLQRFPWQQ